MSELLKTRGGAFAQHRTGELFLHAAMRTSTDEEWREHCDNLRKLGARGTPCRAMLIFGTGSGPTSKQRQILTEEYADVVATCRYTALLTDNTIARGVLTAIGWLLEAKVKTFTFGELDRALSWLAPHAKFEAGAAQSALFATMRAVGADPGLLTSTPALSARR